MDIQLHYIENGEGEPLLLLHGNGENSDYFVHQMAYFSKNYQVIAIDTRGHGLSPRGEAPFTIRQFADDLLAFMDAHAIKKAHILGFSDGGNIALIFALNHPERVNRLILNAANLNGNGVKLWVQIPIIIGYKFASFFAKNYQNARKKAERLGLMVHDPNINPEDLSTLHIKTLVIVGTKDMIKDAHTQLIYESLPDAELSMISGDHFIAHKNPEAFNRAVEMFLTRDNI